MYINFKETLLKRLPREYHNRVVSFERYDDLIDDCMYLLRYSDDYTDGDCYGGSIPFWTIREAIYFIIHDLYKPGE